MDAVGPLLSAVRARQAWLLRAEGAAWAFGCVAVLLLSGALAGGLSAKVGLGLLWAAPLAAVAVGLVLPAVRARRTVGDDRATARLVADRVPDVGHAVLSAVELRQSTDVHASPALVQAFLATAEARAAGVKAVQVVDGRAALKAWRLSLGVVLACVALGLLSRERVQAGLTASLAPRTESPPPPVVEPVTGDVELSFEYPPWTGLAPRTVPGTNGEVTAPAGTRVSLKARADRRVVRAELNVNGATVPLQVAGERELSGAFILQQSGSYRFRFLDARGRLDTEGPPIALKAEPDAEPKVALLSPGDEVEVDPDERLALRYDVSDDYGLTSLELVFQVLGRKGEQRITLPRDDGRSLQGTYTWDMAPLKLRPGDRVSYYLEAKDNDGAAGPKRGVSRTLSLRTYSAAEHRREALKKAEALWDRLVLHLADRVEGPDRSASASAALLREGAQVDQAGTALCADLLAAAAELNAIPDAPGELAAALSNISASLSTRVKATATARRSVVGAAADGTLAQELDPGRRLQRAVVAEISEAEKDVLYLEALIDRGRIQDLKELAAALAAERRELTSLVEEYKKTNDPVAREDILRRVAEMKAHINELMQRMAELARGIRDEHFNAEAMRDLMKEQDLSETLDEVDQLMKDGKVDDALKKLQELSMQMEEMIQGMDKADEQVGQDVDPALAEAFQQFQDTLEQTAKEQQQLAEQTRELRDRYREKVKERVQQKAKELKAQLLKEVEKVSADYGSLEPDDLASRAQRPLEAAQAELENLRNALMVEDFDLALEAGTRAEDAARQLEQYGEQQVAMDEVFKNPPEARAQTKRNAERLHQDAKTLREVNEKLEQLFPSPAQALSEQDKQKLKQLADKQQGLKKQAEQLRQQMEELGEKAPIFDPEAQAQVQGAAQRMEQAAKKLEAKDAPRGHGEQRAALEQLQKLQQQLQQQGQGSKRGGLPMPLRAGGQRQGGNGRNREKVEIPDADQFQAPREYRKDLLDAMKQGAPDRYKDQVKRYYEELVK
ncbi:MAG: hypothetical protein RL653_436 [Pseudomonadota bacterium]